MTKDTITPAIAAAFENKTVLITGGTGSFGQAFLERIRPLRPKEIRIFSRDEWKQEQLRQTLSDPRVKFYLGDVRDRASVDEATYGVDYVFHAAALKQVPSCEFFPMQAVATNIVGSENVVQSAIAHGVKKLVALSTDKAVYPVNAMGMSKAMMEKVLQAAARSAHDTCLSLVRYGNVMASRGSVIPLFIAQIRAGKPITLTVPEMTRFMLPLPQASALVAFAFEHAKSGDLFVRKSPACTVLDLATALKNLFQSKVAVERIGIRHGEKIYETLASREELARAEDMGDYYRIPMDGRDLNYGQFYSEGSPKSTVIEDYTSHNTEQLDVKAVEQLLRLLPYVQSELNAAGLS